MPNTTSQPQHKMPWSMTRSYLRCGTALAICLSAAAASAADPPKEFPLWPDGLPTDAVKIDSERAGKLQNQNTSERIYYVDSPTITIHKSKTPNGCGVVIFPGGGYNVLAFDKEGTEIAQWFNTIGVTAGVVKYRVPRRRPERHVEPVQDGQRAIRWVRHHAKKLDIDPDRVGALGFSAGGHLTLMAGMHAEHPLYVSRDEIDDESAKPDFICPIYCAYLGTDYQDKRAELGNLVKVSNNTPPTFLSVTADDGMRAAQAALLFVELKKAGGSAELHIFRGGGHGYGIRGDFPASRWNRALHQWLIGESFIPTSVPTAQ